MTRSRGDALIFCRISQIRLVACCGRTANNRYAPSKARLLRIGAQRARPGGRSGYERDLVHGGSEVHACRWYQPRGDAVFNPVGERREEIEFVSRGSARAMTHVRDRVEPREVLGRIQAAELFCHFFVVLDRAEDRWARIAEAMIPDDLVPV